MCVRECVCETVVLCLDREEPMAAASCGLQERRVTGESSSSTLSLSHNLSHYLTLSIYFPVRSSQRDSMAEGFAPDG